MKIAEMIEITMILKMNFNTLREIISIFLRKSIHRPTKKEKQYEVAVPSVMAKIPKCGKSESDTVRLVMMLKNVMYIGVFVLE